MDEYSERDILMNQERMHTGVRSREVCCITYKTKSMERIKTAYEKKPIMGYIY